MELGTIRRSNKGIPDSTLTQHCPGSLWYAVYTRSNHEKRVSEGLLRRSVEQFLPFFERVRSRGGRDVRMHKPLFAGYLFVRIDIHDRLRVLQIPGVVRLVSFNGVPIAISNDEVVGLQRALTWGLNVEPYPYLRIGNRVRVSAGPLCGLTGKLVRRKKNYRIVISIDSIMRSIIAEVSLADLEVPERARMTPSNAMPAISSLMVDESCRKLSA